MRRFVSVLAAFLLVLSLASCGNPEKISEKYIESAAVYVDIEDYENAIYVIRDGLKKYPDNEQLSAYLAELEKLFEEQNAPATVESVKEKFIELKNLYYIWFVAPFENLPISDENYREGAYSERFSSSWTFSRVINDEKIKSKSELDRMFRRYCSEELYAKMSLPSGYYEDIDGKFCITSSEEESEIHAIAVDDETVKVIQNSNNEFTVTFLVIHDNGRSPSAWSTLKYQKGEKGGYKFRNYSEAPIETLIKSGEYIVKIQEEELPVYKFPRETSEKTGAFKKEQKINVLSAIDGWVYAEADDIGGWINAEAIRDAAEQDYGNGRTNHSSYGNAAAQIVGGAVDAGIYVAGKILNRLF